METNKDGLDVVKDTVAAQESETSTMEQPEQTMEQPMSENTDWQAEAKKFQSMHDRVQAENAKLAQLKPIGDLLEKRPDITQTIEQMIVDPNGGSKKQETTVDESEFNPWDAYYKPDSASYKFRRKKQEEVVSDAMAQVRNEFAEREQQAQQRQYLNQTVSDLRTKHKMSDIEISEFLDWSNQPKEAVGIGNLVKLFKDVKGNKAQTQNSIDAVKANQQSPQSAGVLQGQTPIEKSDTDSAFERVLGASGAGKLPLASVK